MTEKPFNRSDAESLLQPIGTGNYWKIKKRGVWPKKPVKKHKEEKHAHEPGELIDLEFDSWRPVMVFSASTLPQRPEDRPALPFPFDAKDLAAFMLYGFGPLVADHYGDWEDGPDQLRLNELSSLNLAKRAVKEAFEAYREAQKIVGPYPLELDAEAERAHKAWWPANNEANEREGVFSSTPGTDESKIRRARAVASTAELESKMKATAEAARAAQEAWLAAMVRQLLQPLLIEEPATPAQITASEPYEATGKVRLELLRSLGGSARYSQGEWKFKGILALVKREKAAGRNRSDEKTIRGDLKEAAEDERQAKAAGFGSGLGQR